MDTNSTGLGVVHSLVETVSARGNRSGASVFSQLFASRLHRCGIHSRELRCLEAAHDAILFSIQTPEHTVMSKLNRRAFIAESSKTLAGIAAGSALLKVSHSATGQSANDKVVLALMGAGGRGSGLAQNFSAIPNVEFKYVCEVNDQRGGDLLRTLEKAQGRAPQRTKDFRRALEDKDVNGIVVATPEQWHALATVWACQAGKDVYVEKNPSLTIWEGRKMIEAARKYNRVVQVGFQNRSAPYGTSAREYLQSGKLGRVVLVKVFNLLAGGPWQPQPDAPVPAGLDWDSWLGPAPEVPYTPSRLNGWGDYWDYEGGVLAGDGSHQLDLARMALGDPPHPRTVTCTGGRLAYPDSRETPDVQVMSFDFGDFILTCENGTFPPYMKKFPNEVRYGKQWPNWPQSSCRIEIHGTRQMMYLGRHGCGWQALEADGKVVAEDKGYFPDKWHQPNFVECIRTRKRPNADIEQGHYSACLVHLANVAYRSGMPSLRFKAETESFIDCERANQFLKPAYRKHYRVPETV
jgi:predicted dehydrogenase